MIAGTACLAVASCATTAARPAASSYGSITLRVEVTNVRGNSGRVHVDLCRKDEFLKDCPISADAKAVAGTTVVTVPNLTPGDYGAQIFYDANGNGRVDRGLFGIPKEGVGFSRDAPIRLSQPRWQDAVFTLTGDKTITVRLRYFVGGDAKR
ncbi:MAG: DUF2141 domain-containing protein [Sphingomonas sp.]|nr:DUF2141 domain-containing protein [Sphingomonas sp.]